MQFFFVLLFEIKKPSLVVKSPLGPFGTLLIQYKSSKAFILPDKMSHQMYFIQNSPHLFQKKVKKKLPLSTKIQKNYIFPYRKSKRFYNKQLKTKYHHNPLIFYSFLKINFTSLDYISRVTKLAVRIVRLCLCN